MSSAAAAAAAAVSTPSTVVRLQYDDLVAEKDLSAQILAAYGPGGLGALTIAGIPQFAEMRARLLPLAHRLAHLPPDELAKLEHDASMWNAGWSFGREKMGDRADTSKGSFYANPLHDVPASDEEQQRFPWAWPTNVWPTTALPELEAAFKSLGRLMYDVVVLLCREVDRVIARAVPGYEAGSLHRHMAATRKVKGRLLYYFPPTKVPACAGALGGDAAEKSAAVDAAGDALPAEDGWIGWHNDSGFLTALTSAMFFDDDSGEQIDNPDSAGGLWIVDRSSGTVRVRVPADELAVQCGECLQIVSGGTLVATPHCVRPSRPPRNADGSVARHVGRGTFPVFVDVDPTFALCQPAGVSRDAVFERTVQSRVPPLAPRWRTEGMSFGDFLGSTFEAYYAHNKQQPKETPKANDDDGKKNADSQATKQ